MADEFDQERLWFLRGALAALASSGQVVHYDELRRLCRFSREQMGAYLGEARRMLREDEPDFCAIVVNDGGWPGQGFGTLDDWPAALRAAHRYWQGRRQQDNTAFVNSQGDLPSVPGLPGRRSA